MSPTAARRPPTRAAKAAESGTTDPDLRDPSLYFDRELSWLSFNDRVLEQASAATRCSSAPSSSPSPPTTSTSFSWCGSTSADSRARARATAMLGELSQFWEETLRRQLARRAHRRSSMRREYTDDDRAYLERHFNVDVCPVLTPLAFDPGHPFPLVSNRSKNLAVVVEHKGRTKFARVKVPDLLPRFVALPARGRHAPVRDARRRDSREPRAAVSRRGHPHRAHVPRRPRHGSRRHPSAGHRRDHSRSRRSRAAGAAARPGLAARSRSRHAARACSICSSRTSRRAATSSCEPAAGWGSPTGRRSPRSPRPELRDQPLKPAKIWRKGSPDIFDEIRYRDQHGASSRSTRSNRSNRSSTRRSTIRASSRSR